MTQINELLNFMMTQIELLIFMMTQFLLILC